MGILKNLVKVAVGAALIYATGGTAALFGSATATLSIGTMSSAFLGSIVMAAGVGLVATGAMGAAGLGPKQPKYESPGARLRLTADPDAPRWVCYGRAATGGSLLYRETTGAKNENLFMVVAVAGHEITAFEDFTWGGKAISFSSGNAVGDLSNFMYKYDHLGTDGQSADSALDAASAKWTANHKLGGIAYAVLKLVYDVDKHPNGIQSPVFTIKGRKLYDPRLDDTNGGVGTHRLNDPSTWAWSDNPALVIADYLRGIHVANSVSNLYDGTRVAGMGVDVNRMDWGAIITAADICDEPVALKGGGSEKRYTLNGFVDPTASHKQNIERMAQAMAGAVVFQGGKWRLYAGKTRLPSESRTAEHIIGGLEFKAKAGWDGRVNSVRGQWIDPSSGYKPRDIPPLVSAAYKLEDGGQEIWADIDLPFTTSGTMAQRLSKIYLGRARRQRTVSATFMPVAIRDQVMDVVNFSHDTFNISAERFVVADWALRAQADSNGNMGLVVQETLIEEPSALYEWDEVSEEQSVPTVGITNRADRQKSDLGELNGTADFATQISGTEKPENNATVDTRYPTQNLLGPDAGPENSGLLAYLDQVPISDLGLITGHPVALSAWLNAEGVAVNLRVILQWFDASYTLISGGVSTTFENGTGWVYHESGVVTVPATAVYVKVYLGKSSGSGGLGKQVMLARASKPLPYEEPPFRPNRERGDVVKYISGDTMESLKPLDAGATVDSRYSSHNLAPYIASGEVNCGSYLFTVPATNLAAMGLQGGDVMAFSAWCNAEGTGTSVRPRLFFFDASLVAVGTFDPLDATGATVQATSGSVYEWVSGWNLTIPATATSVAMFAYRGGGTGGKMKWGKINHGPRPTPYDEPSLKIGFSELEYGATLGALTGTNFKNANGDVIYDGDVLLRQATSDLWPNGDMGEWVGDKLVGWQNNTPYWTRFITSEAKEGGSVLRAQAHLHTSIAPENTRHIPWTPATNRFMRMRFRYRVAVDRSDGPTRVHISWLGYDENKAFIYNASPIVNGVYKSVADGWQEVVYNADFVNWPSTIKYILPVMRVGLGQPTIAPGALVDFDYVHMEPVIEGEYQRFSNGDTVHNRTNRFDNTGRSQSVHSMPANTIAGPSSAVNLAPISAYDAGTTATITIAAHTRQFDSGAVGYNSGSITGRAFSTTYYIYTDDPTLVGGARTYVATTNILDLTAIAGRVYVGRVTTPADGGGSTYQEPTSGGGELP